MSQRRAPSASAGKGSLSRKDADLVLLDDGHAMLTVVMGGCLRSGRTVNTAYILIFSLGGIWTINPRSLSFMVSLIF
jgi:hypothetical protein